MKKLFITLGFLFAIASITIAQTATFSISKNKTHKEVNTNYALTNTTAVWFLVNTVPNTPSTQDYQCVLNTTTAGQTSVVVGLYGRKFSDDSWTQIGSDATWTIGSSDSTLTISNTTPNRYRQYKVNAVGVGTGVTYVNSQEFKLYKE